MQRCPIILVCVPGRPRLSGGRQRPIDGAFASESIGRFKQQATSDRGQTEKNSARSHLFRFTPRTRHNGRHATERLHDAGGQELSLSLRARGVGSLQPRLPPRPPRLLVAVPDEQALFRWVDAVAGERSSNAIITIRGGRTQQILDLWGHEIDLESNASNPVPFSQHTAKNGRLDWKLLSLFIAVVASDSYF